MSDTNAKSLNLIFLGGIADTRKSPLIAALKIQCSELLPFAVSDYLKKAMGLTTTDKLGAEISLIDWKRYESKAVGLLAAEIKGSYYDKGKTVIINTHFATYSPSGFMIGLDPSSIMMLSEACNLSAEPKLSKAAIVLVDISIADVMHLRQTNWSTSSDGLTTAVALAEDLEANRNYALHYYSVLASHLGSNRTMFYRLYISYENAKSGKAATDLPEFGVALNDVKQFLYQHKFAESKI